MGCYRYIDTKPNHELIYYCLDNPLYELGWKVKKVSDADGNLTTTTDRSTVDACSNACEMWKAIERSQQAATRNRGKASVNSLSPTYDQEPDMVTEDEALSKEIEIDKVMDLISLSFKKIYKPTNNNLRTSLNTSRANLYNTLRTNRGTGYDNQRVVNIAGARENVEQADWKDDTNEPEDQKLEAYYLYKAHIQEVTPYGVDNSRPIFDTEPF
uniref:Uncharacterized protein n=1 Tax=Tanacetum cinerariifolium TaxID=118510 RepID=A0A699KB66_TANCI|nr:hypothetical protein [Tanacetum cinerariifolium]